MSKGFLYVVHSVRPGYVQEAFHNVPTQWRDRLYFGPCKIPMRRKMAEGDWVFGISPAIGTARRIVFVAELEEPITFEEAYNLFPDLRGPVGPIHVRPLPVKGRGPFPESSYQHIPGAMHAESWINDLKTKNLDKFFVCSDRDRWRGRWLGKYGPEIDNELLKFLKTCSVHGAKGQLSSRNTYATLAIPLAHRGQRGYLYRVHLETDQAETLIELCNSRMERKTELLDRVLTLTPRPGAPGECGIRKEVSTSRPIHASKRAC